MNKKQHISKMGYRDDSPYRGRESININTPSGIIDMSQTGIPLFANGQLLQPYSGQHYMGTTNVTEIPAAQMGHEVKKRKGKRENEDGSHSTHLMKTETIDGINWFSFPSLFQNDDGEWIDMSEDEDWKLAAMEAEKRGELYHFGTNKAEALKFGEGSWKPENKSILEMQRGGGLPKAQFGVMDLFGPVASAVNYGIDYAKNKIADNVDPWGYEDAFERVNEAIFTNEDVEYEGDDLDAGTERRDLLHMLMGLEQENNSINAQTQYTPTIGHNEGNIYYDSPYTEGEIKREISKLGKSEKNVFFIDEQTSSMKNFDKELSEADLNKLWDDDQLDNIDYETYLLLTENEEDEMYEGKQVVSWEVDPESEDEEDLNSIYFKDIPRYKTTIESEGYKKWATDIKTKRNEQVKTETLADLLTVVGNKEEGTGQRGGFYGGVLGNFTLNQGEDEQGTYISYADLWDLSPFQGNGGWKEKLTDFGQEYILGTKPAQVYNRMYYTTNDEGEMIFEGQTEKPMNAKQKKKKDNFQIGGSTSNSKIQNDILNANIEADKWNKEYVQSDNYMSMLKRAKEKPSVIKSRINAAMDFDPMKNITYDENNYSLGQYYNNAYSSSDGSRYPISTFQNGEGMLNYNPTLFANHPAYNNEGVASGGWPALAGHELIGHYGVDKLNRKQRKALKSVIDWPSLDSFAGDNNDAYDHGRDPYEMRANLAQLRYQLDKSGIYDSKKGLAVNKDGEEGDNPFNMEHLKQVLDFDDNGNFLQVNPKFNNEILQFVAPQDLIWMMNNIAMDQGDDLPEGTMNAKYGAELPQFQKKGEKKEQTYKVRVVQYPYGYQGGEDGSDGAGSMNTGHMESFVLDQDNLPGDWSKKNDEGEYINKGFVNRWDKDYKVYNPATDTNIEKGGGDYERGVRTVDLELTEKQMNHYMNSAQTYKGGRSTEVPNWIGSPLGFKEGSIIPGAFGQPKEEYNVVNSNCADGVCWALDIDDDRDGNSMNIANMTDPTKVMDYLMTLSNASNTTGEKRTIQNVLDGEGDFNQLDGLYRYGMPALELIDKGSEWGGIFGGPSATDLWNGTLAAGEYVGEAVVDAGEAVVDGINYVEDNTDLQFDIEGITNVPGYHYDNWIEPTGSAIADGVNTAGNAISDAWDWATDWEWEKGGELPKAQLGITEFKQNNFGHIETEKGYDVNALFNFAKDKYTKVNTATQKSDLVTKLNSPVFRERYAKNIFNISGEKLSEEELTNRISQQSDFTEAGPDFHVKMPFVTNRNSGGLHRFSPYIYPFSGTNAEGKGIGRGGLDWRSNSGLYQQKQNNGNEFAGEIEGSLFGSNFFTNVTNPDFPELAKYPYIPQLADMRNSEIMSDNQVAPFDGQGNTIVHEYAHSYNTNDSPLFNPEGENFVSLDKDKYDDNGNMTHQGTYSQLPGEKYKGWLTNLFGESYWDKEQNAYGTWAMHPWEISSIKSETENVLKNNNIWDNTKGEFGESNLNKMMEKDYKLDIGGHGMDPLNRMGYRDLERMNYKNSQSIKKQGDVNWDIDYDQGGSEDYIMNNIINAEDNPAMNMDAFNTIFNNSQSNLKDRQKYPDYNSLLEDYKTGSKRKQARAAEVLKTIYGDFKDQINQGYNTENENYQIEYDKKKGEVLPKLEMYFNEIAMEEGSQPTMAKYGGSLPKAQFGPNSIMNGNAHGLFPEGTRAVTSGNIDGSDLWDKFEKSSVGQFLDADGFVDMFAMNGPNSLIAPFANYFGYGEDEGTDMALDAIAMVNPTADFVHAGTKFNEGEYTDAALYGLFGILPGTAGPLVKGVKDKIINPIKNAFKSAPAPRGSTLNSFNQIKTSFDDLLDLPGNPNLSNTRNGILPLRNGQLDMTVTGQGTQDFMVQVNKVGDTKSGMQLLTRLDVPNAYYIDMSMTNPLEAGQTMKYLTEFMPKGSTISSKTSLSMDSYKLMLNRVKRGDFSIVPNQTGSSGVTGNSMMDLNMMAKGTEKGIAKNGLVSKVDAEQMVKEINEMLSNAGVENQAKSIRMSPEGTNVWKVQMPNLTLQMQYEQGGETSLPIAQDGEETNDNFSDLEKGIKWSESLNGTLMKNPESSASGYYGDLFDNLDYDGTRDEFIADTDYQEEYFRKRAHGEVENVPGLINNGIELLEEYNDVDHGLTALEISALSNMLGRQGTREYLGNVIRDGSTLAEVFPHLYGEDLNQTNKTPQEYIDKFNEGVLKKKMGGSVKTKVKRLNQQLELYNNGSEISPMAKRQLESLNMIKPKMQKGGSITHHSYKIKKGDSLSRIAKDNDISLSDLLSFNPSYMNDPSSIQPNQILQLSKNATLDNNRPRLKYKIKKGDTLSHIASKYGVKYEDIANINNISDPRSIQPDQVLILPDNSNTTDPVIQENIKVAESVYVPSVDEVDVDANPNVNVPWAKRTFNESTNKWETKGKRNTKTEINKMDQSNRIIQGMNEIDGKDKKTINYKIKSGDNLSLIAQKNGVTTKQLMTDNNISNADNIQTGQDIKINKSSGKPFIVVDEKLGRMHLYYPGQDEPSESFPILTGANEGDAQTVTKIGVFKDGKKLDRDELNKAMEDNLPEDADWTIDNLLEVEGYTSDTDWEAGNKQTGAGIYKIKMINEDSGFYDDSGNGGPTPSFVLNNSNGDEVPMVIHTAPSKGDGRVENLNDNDASNNRVTNGCINGRCEDLTALYNNPDVGEGTVIYVLPESTSGSNFVYENGEINYYASRDVQTDAQTYIDERGVEQDGHGIANKTTTNYKPINITFDKNYYQTNSERYDGTAAGEEEEFVNNTQPFLNSIADNKKLLMDKLGMDGDMYNDLSMIAFGIYGYESGMGDEGSAGENFLKAGLKWTGLQDTSPDVKSKHDTYGVDGAGNSVGWTQIRWNQLDDSEKEALSKIDITSNDQLMDPANAAKATTAILYKRYQNQISRKDKNSEDFDIFTELPKKWNKGEGYSDVVNKYMDYINLTETDIDDVDNNLIIKGEYTDYNTESNKRMDNKPVEEKLLNLGETINHNYNTSSVKPYVDVASLVGNMLVDQAGKAITGAYDATTEAVGDAYDATTEAVSDAGEAVSDWWDEVDLNPFYKPGGEFGVGNQSQFYNDYINGKYKGTKQENKSKKMYDKLNRMYYNDSKKSNRHQLDIMNSILRSNR